MPAGSFFGFIGAVANASLLGPAADLFEERREQLVEVMAGRGDDGE